MNINAKQAVCTIIIGLTSSYIASIVILSRGGFQPEIIPVNLIWTIPA